MDQSINRHERAKKLALERRREEHIRQLRLEKEEHIRQLRLERNQIIQSGQEGNLFGSIPHPPPAPPVPSSGASPYPRSVSSRNDVYGAINRIPLSINPYNGQNTVMDDYLRRIRRKSLAIETRVNAELDNLCITETLEMNQRDIPPLDDKEKDNSLSMKKNKGSISFFTPEEKGVKIYQLRDDIYELILPKNHNSNIVMGQGDRLFKKRMSAKTLVIVQDGYLVKRNKERIKINPSINLNYLPYCTSQNITEEDFFDGRLHNYEARKIINIMELKILR